MFDFHDHLRKQRQLNEQIIAAIGLVARQVFGNDADRFDEPKHNIQGTDIGNILMRLGRITDELDQQDAEIKRLHERKEEFMRSADGKETSHVDCEAVVMNLIRENNRREAEIERLRAALGDARQALNLALLVDGLQNDIKVHLRIAWLKVGNALTLGRAVNHRRQVKNI